MTLYAPVLDKIKYSVDVEVERILPARGDIVVKAGEQVVPFTKVGRAKVAKEYIELPINIKFTKGKQKGSYFYKGEKIGRLGLKRFIAPYNGTLVETSGNNMVFYQEEKDVWILSGVWGQVSEIANGQSVKVKTQAVDVNLAAFTSNYAMGELIVFPNPSELLDIEYLQNFSKSIQNRIIYVGHHIRKEVVDKAAELNITALIGGSVLKEVFTHAKKLGVSIGVTTGFGKFNTPTYAFDFLKGVSNRHVFFDGYNGLLRIPVPPQKAIPAGFKVTAHPKIKALSSNDEIFILEEPHFGKVGIVNSVQDNLVYVKLNKSDEEIAITWPNLYILA